MQQTLPPLSCLLPLDAGWSPLVCSGSTKQLCGSFPCSLGFAESLSAAPLGQGPGTWFPFPPVRWRCQPQRLGQLPRQSEGRRWEGAVLLPDWDLVVFIDLCKLRRGEVWVLQLQWCWESFRDRSGICFALLPQLLRLGSFKGSQRRVGKSVGKCVTLCYLKEKYIHCQFKAVRHLRSQKGLTVFTCGPC